jgi:molecular chaperone GrpE
MSHDGDKGAFSTDIPDEAIAEALAAVEKRAVTAPEVEVDGEPPAPAPMAELDRLRLELEMSQERARKVYEALKEEHDQRLRGAADLENYRKRAAREKDEIQRYGTERLVKEILPVIDNLDRALAAAAEHPLTTGIAMTRRLLEDALARVGVKAFSSAGQAFDPRLHEALMTVATGEHPPGTVIEEQQRGFFMHDRLIRPAAVVVSAAPPASDGGAGPGEGALR